MRILLILLFLIIISTTAAQDAGIESIFNFGVGARALALGRAFTSLGHDPTCIYWNPASLPLLPQKELTSLHVPLYLSSGYNFFGFAMPTRTLGGFGIGGINARTAGIEVRNAQNLMLGESDYSETEYLFSYGGRVPRAPLVSRVFTPLYAGVTMKLIHQSLAEFSAIGTGADVGFLWTPRAPSGLRFGVSLQNILPPTLKLNRTSDRLPLLVRGGTSFSSQFGSVGEWLVAFDVDKAASRAIKYHAGGELNIRELFTLRTGWDGDFALGFGLNYWRLGFDYAYVTREPGALHCFSVNFRIGRTIEEDWIAVKKLQAEEEMRRAEEERKTMINRHSGIAVKLYENGDYFGALGEWQKVLGFDPENPEAERWVDQITGEIQSVQEDAIKDKELLALINEHIDSGVEFLTKGDYERAISEWNKVLELDPANSTAKEYLAKTQALLTEQISKHVTEAGRLESQKKYGEALSEWRKALRLDPEHSRAISGVERITRKIAEAHHINLGFEYFTGGDFDMAAIEFKAALALNPENKTAVEYLRKSVGRKSLIEIAGDREVWRLYLKGIEYFTNAEYEEAIRVWEEVLRLDPENENAVRNIEEARLRLRKGVEESDSKNPSER